LELAENEIKIQHGVISVFPYFVWQGRVKANFDGVLYERVLERRFLKRRAKEDARVFAEWLSSEMQKEGFNIVAKW
jgi:hypothetical protein